MSKNTPQRIPVHSTLLLTALVGFLVSLFAMIYGGLDPTWGISFALVFGFMLVASAISMLPHWPEELKK